MRISRGRWPVCAATVLARGAWRRVAAGGGGRLLWREAWEEALDEGALRLRRVVEAAALEEEELLEIGEDLVRVGVRVGVGVGVGVTVTVGLGLGLGLGLGIRRPGKLVSR